MVSHLRGRDARQVQSGLRAFAGVRVAILPRVHLLAEIEATRDWLLHGSSTPDYRNSIANTLAFHASVGALFEY